MLRPIWRLRLASVPSIFAPQGGAQRSLPICGASFFSMNALSRKGSPSSARSSRTSSGDRAPSPPACAADRTDAGRQRQRSLLHRVVRGDRAACEIGRAHVRTPVTNAHLVCRLLLEKKKETKN